MNQKQSVKNFLKEFASAMERKDTAAVVSHYHPENVMYILVPPLQNDSTKSTPGAEGLQQWFDAFEGNIRYENRDLHIEADDNLAYAYYLLHLTGKKTDGKEADLWHRATDCLINVDGEWKIKHQHQSVPYNMETGMAELGLKPQ